MIEKQSKPHNILLIGHCTDSAGNSLQGSVRLATPSNYEVMDGRVKFLGLTMEGFVFYAPILRKGFPSIAYPCWDHRGRTSLHNLMNERIQIVAEAIPNTKADGSDGFAKYLIATVQDLKALKKLHRYPNSTVRQADITAHVRQNCDATVRVLSNTTLEELSKYLPCAKATYLYLKASLWIIGPYRNEKFGSPPEVVQSLWARIMTWRRWRRYVEITNGLTLKYNFISRSHYTTLELMGHAGILHQLALYLAFQNFDTESYSL